jgi:hypothetical protein
MAELYFVADGSCRSTSSRGGGNSCNATLNVWSAVLQNTT